MQLDFRRRLTVRTEGDIERIDASWVSAGDIFALNGIHRRLMGKDKGLEKLRACQTVDKRPKLTKEG